MVNTGTVYSRIPALKRLGSALLLILMILGVAVPAWAESATERAIRREKEIKERRMEQMVEKGKALDRQMLRDKRKKTSKKGASPLDNLSGEVELSDLLSDLSEYCGYNLMYESDRNKGKKVLIYNHNALNRKDACEIWRQMLDLSDKSFYKANAFLKVINRRDIQDAPIPVGTEGKIPSGAKYDFAITIFKPKNQLSLAGHFASLSRFLLTPNGKNVFLEPDTILLIDERDNLLRMLKMFKILDRPEPELFVYAIPLEYMSVAEFSKLVTDLFPKPDLERWQPGKGAGYGPEYQVATAVDDERTSQVIVVCNEAAYGKIIELRNALDVAAVSEGLAKVVYLQHQTAKDLAQTLNAVLRVSGRGARGKGAAAKGEVISAEVKIIPDEKLNALIVSGLQKDIERVVEVVQRLDTPRRQVFLEVNILEFAESKTGNQGIGLFYSRNDDGTVSFVQSSYSGAKPLVLDPTSLMGLAVGVRGEEVEGTDQFVSGIRLPSVATLLRLLQTTSNVNVVSSPFLLAQDGEEAQMVVGSSVPFFSGGSINSFGTQSVAIQHEDVAMTMKIVPTVGPKGTVRMQIEVEIEDIESMSDTMGPTTSKRAIKATVITKDGATVVMGGLEKEVNTRDESKVPFVGDIPILGAFFRASSTRSQKINLIVFIKPYVVDSVMDLQKLYKAKVRENREFVQQFNPNQQTGYEHPIDWDRKIGPLEAISQSQ